MASIVDSLRDRWEQMAPRERKLAAITAGAVIFCIAVFVARGIAGGLSDLEAENDLKREALHALAEQRAGAAASKKPGVEIPATPTKLSKYVDGIVTAVGITSPSYPQPKELKKGEHVEYSFNLKLPKLTITQLQEFLEKLETGSKIVIVRELRVKRNFRDKELLDVELQIATYAKAPKDKKGDKDKGKGDEG